MSLSFHDHSRRAAHVVGVALLATAVPAGAAVSYSLGLDAQAMAASNPLLLQGDDLAALLVEGTLRPGMVISDDGGGTSIDLGGALTGRAYSRRYGRYLLGDAHANASWRHNERLTGTARAEFRRDVSADTLSDAVDASIDPRSTRNALDTSLAFAWTPGTRDTWTPRIQYQRTSFTSSTALGTTTAAIADLAYSRRLNARTSLGARGAITSSQARPGGKFLTYALYGTIDQRLTPVLRLNAELGAEHSQEDGRSTLPSGRSADSRTTFSGRGALCADGGRLTGCLNATVATEISALGALQRRFTAGASAARPIGTRQTISLVAEYQRAERDGPTAMPTVSAASLRGAFDWRLAEHVTLSASLEYRRRDFGSSQSADGGVAGLQFRWTR